MSDRSPARLLKRAAAWGAAQAGRVVGSRRGLALATPADYFRRTPLLGYSGWIGKANLGDEALYDAFTLLFPDHRLIAAGVPQPVELLLHRALLRGGRPYDALLLGGGTLIHHASYLRVIQDAIQAGIPFAVFGTGVIDTSFWSVHRPATDWEARRAAWRDALAHAAYIGVRGPDSAAMLAEQGVSAEVIGDPALATCPTPVPRTPASRRIALNTGNIGPMWGDQRDVQRTVTEVVRALHADGWRVDLFALHHTDRRCADQIAADVPEAVDEVWHEYRDTARFNQMLARYDLVVSQKLHGAVLAAALGIPVVSLAYEPKCIDFMRSVGAERLVHRTDALDPAAIINAIAEAYEDAERISATICERVALYQGAQREAAARARDLMGLAPAPRPNLHRRPC